MKSLIFLRRTCGWNFGWSKGEKSFASSCTHVVRLGLFVLILRVGNSKKVTPHRSFCFFNHPYLFFFFFLHMLRPNFSTFTWHFLWLSVPNTRTCILWNVFALYYIVFVSKCTSFLDLNPIACLDLPLPQRLTLPTSHQPLLEGKRKVNICNFYFTQSLSRRENIWSSWPLKTETNDSFDPLEDVIHLPQCKMSLINKEKRSWRDGTLVLWVGNPKATVKKNK